MSRKTLLELRTLGFEKLKPRHIHVRCPDCGCKVSNAERAEDEPSNAVLAEVLCPDCGVGCRPTTYYFDADGNAIREDG